MSMIGKIKTGDWDGQPIWREKTAGEVLAKELEKTMSKEEKDLLDDILAQTKHND